MEITEYLASYSGIMAKVGQMGKVKTNLVNKKLTAQALESWQRLSAEELARIDQEIGSAEVFNKCMTFTSSAVIYNNLGALYVVPVKDILWVFPYVVTQRMNFIPYNKIHQIRIVDRTGDEHVIIIGNTGGFSKKEPAVDILQKMSAAMTPVRPVIVFGYSEDANRLFHGNLQQGIAMVDQRSGC